MARRNTHVSLATLPHRKSADTTFTHGQPRVSLVSLRTPSHHLRCRSGVAAATYDPLEHPAQHSYSSSA